MFGIFLGVENYPKGIHHKIINSDAFFAEIEIDTITQFKPLRCAIKKTAVFLYSSEQSFYLDDNLNIVKVFFPWLPILWIRENTQVRRFLNLRF